MDAPPFLNHRPNKDFQGQSWVDRRPSSSNDIGILIITSAQMLLQHRKYYWHDTSKSWGLLKVLPHYSLYLVSSHPNQRAEGHLNCSQRETWLEVLIFSLFILSGAWEPRWWLQMEMRREVGHRVYSQKAAQCRTLQQFSDRSEGVHSNLVCSCNHSFVVYT